MATTKLSSGLITTLIVTGGAFFLLAGLGGYLQLLQVRELMANGRVAEGEVTGLRAANARGSRLYHFDYAYIVGGSRHAKIDRSLPYGDHQAMRSGAKIRVWYDPANPDRSVTVAERASSEESNHILLPGIGLALLAWAAARIFGISFGRRRL